MRQSYDETTGDITKRYYPVTRATEDGLGYVLSGYKIREHPKDFFSKGATGQDCMLFGQFRFKGGKYCLIVEGEEDQLAAYQMFQEYSESKGSEFITAVVSPTVGANSAKQIAKQYKFFDSFENIIIGYDNDSAGKEAIEDIVAALPKGKVSICSWRYKDPNEYLEKGTGRQFIQDFYNNKKYVPSGVVGSGDLYNMILEGTLIQRVALPPFMKKLDDLLGGIELGTIGVLGAGSGSAKTTVANELLYYWIFNSPYKVGVVSLELTCSQYGQAMLSRHIEKKLSLIRDNVERRDYISQDEVKEKAKELFYDEEHGHRFMLIDERDGSIEDLQEKIEELIISCECKIIVLDPISDLFDGLSIEEQAILMKWMKSMVKNYGVTFILIAHIRKGSNNKEAASAGNFVPEEALAGSSTLFKSASWVVMMQRDKYALEDIVRNTTHLTLSKNRNGGSTGKAGSLYYCNETHMLHDLDEWLEKNGPKDF